MKYLLYFAVLAGLLSCRPASPPLTEQQVAMAWGLMTTQLAKTTPGNSPTYASRSFGYCGLTMYESVVVGYQSHQSVAAQLNGLTGMPKPMAGQTYVWLAALNAGQASILKNIYIQTSDANRKKIDSLEQLVRNQLLKTSDKAVIARSEAYGRQVAEAVFEWSKTDGGHRGYLKNFDKKLVNPTHSGCWKPPLYGQSFSHYPLHPHWGKNRPFLVADSLLIPPKPLPYSKEKNSPYYQAFREVYDKTPTLTQAEKEAALWWGDDPDETFTPPGHSYYVATLILQQKKPPLIQCAETYARVGIAVADAFRNCWRWKYQYFTERPNTFIVENIDPRFESFWPDPPFPAFPSGHAMNAGALAGVLTALYGNTISFTDSSHVGRTPDDLRRVAFTPRRFNSFSEMAAEIADSRFYGGIHTRHDNAEGLRKGAEIADNVNKLPWRRPGFSPKK